MDNDKIKTLIANSREVSQTNVGDTQWEMTLMSFIRRLGDALELSLPPMPTGDERELLHTIISEHVPELDPDGCYEGTCWCGVRADDHNAHQADAILAAGFRVTPEPDYGDLLESLVDCGVLDRINGVYELSDVPEPVYQYALLGDTEPSENLEDIVRFRGTRSGPLLRRVKAGKWEPLPVEGEK